ncbi:MAG TPA: dienelactone hydrolase family protein [Pyrinomonadaceae bacterium]
MSHRILSLPLTVLAVAFSVFFAVDRAAAQHMDAHHHSPVVDVANVPEVTQDWAKAQLAKSPRHREWVKVKYGNREVNSLVIFPEVKKKATAVVVIHEINGLSDWVQQLTDELAEAGYIAIAPDLLSGMGPNGGGTADVATKGGNAVGQAIRDLPPDQITADLNAVADYVAKLPAANGKVAVAGYCWGGTQSFRFAMNRPSLKAAFVFYGTTPGSNAQGQPFAVDQAGLTRINAPVYGFYAENDMRVNATIPPAVEAMKALKKHYDPVTYAGAGHGFMRAGEPNAPEPKAPATTGDEAADKKAKEDYDKAITMYRANRKARDDAWVRWKGILAKL